MAPPGPTAPAVASLTASDGGPPAPPRLARSAGIIGTATLTSRLLGLVRDQVLAYLFGAGNAMDAFNVAYRIPNLMRDLFAEGAMSAAFVPTFTRRLTLQGKGVRVAGRQSARQCLARHHRIARPPWNCVRSAAGQTTGR